MPIGSRGGAVAVATTACDADGQSVLHLAARAGAVDAVATVLRRLELEAEAASAQQDEDALRRALDLVDRWERTPLHWALLNGHLEAGALVEMTCRLRSGSLNNWSNRHMGAC